MVEEEVATVVADNGKGVNRTGCARDDAPHAVIHSIVGGHTTPVITVGMDNKVSYVDEEAQSKRGVLAVKYSIEHVDNGGGMCKPGYSGVGAFPSAVARMAAVKFGSDFMHMQTFLCATASPL